MFKRLSFILATLLLVSVVSYGQSRFTRVIRSTSGQLLSGKIVKLYAANTSILKYTLSEDGSAPGTYYKDNVEAGYYDLYVDNIKRLSNTYHADQVKFGGKTSNTPSGPRMNSGKFFLVEGAEHWGMKFDTVRVSGDTVIVRMTVHRDQLASILSDSGVVAQPKYGIPGTTVSGKYYTIRGNGGSGIQPSTTTSGDSVIVELNFNTAGLASYLNSAGYGKIVDTTALQAAADSVKISYVGEQLPIGFRYQQTNGKDSVQLGNKWGWKKFRLRGNTLAASPCANLTIYSDSTNLVSLVGFDWNATIIADNNTSVPVEYLQTFSGTAGRHTWNIGTFTSTSHSEATPGGTAYAPTWQLVASNSSAVGIINGGSGQRRWALQLKPSSSANAWVYDIEIKIHYVMPITSSSATYVGIQNGL